MKAMIVAGGAINDAFILDCMYEEDYDITIAVDKGLDFFYHNKMTPDYIIGDFDSVDKAALLFYELMNKGLKNAEIIKLNPKKDDTDTQHAMGVAIERGAKSIHLFGCTGHRLDHFLGNIQLLGYGYRKGVDCIVYDLNNKIRLIDRETIIAKEEQFGQYVSLLPYTPEVKGLTLEGFLYPLKDYTMGNFYLENAVPISGVSNEIVDETARITLKEGILLMVEAREK